jgi:hypothetical protein
VSRGYKQSEGEEEEEVACCDGSQEPASEPLVRVFRKTFQGFPLGTLTRSNKRKSMGCGASAPVSPETKAIDQELKEAKKTMAAELKLLLLG